MDWGLFLGCINEFRNMQMTKKGGNKSNGNYGIDIKERAKSGGFSGVYGTHRSDIFTTILFSSVCMRRYHSDNLLCYLGLTGRILTTLISTNHAPLRCTFDFSVPTMSSKTSSGV